jgi:hypothetical protein
MAAEKQRGENGRYLKTGLNMADTGSVTHEVRGTVKFGRIAGQENFDGRSSSRNPMVSGNTGLKKRG